MYILSNRKWHGAHLQYDHCSHHLNQRHPSTHIQHSTLRACVASPISYKIHKIHNCALKLAELETGEMDSSSMLDHQPGRSVQEGCSARNESRTAIIYVLVPRTCTRLMVPAGLDLLVTQKPRHDTLELNE